MPHKRYLVSLICVECGQQFIGINYGGDLYQKTCSPKCFKQVMAKHHASLPRFGSDSPTWKGGQPEWVCRRCGKSFRAYRKKAGARRTYCSWICANIANRLTVYDMKSRLQFERMLMELLEGRGYRCLRSAGSRGPVDIFAINANHVRGIQLKTTKNKLNSDGNLGVFKKAVLDLRKLPTPPGFTRELWVKPLRKKWVYVLIDDLPEEPNLLRKALSQAEWIQG